MVRLRMHLTFCRFLVGGSFIFEQKICLFSLFVIHPHSQLSHISINSPTPLYLIQEIISLSEIYCCLKHISHSALSIVPLVFPFTLVLFLALVTPLFENRSNSCMNPVCALSPVFSSNPVPDLDRPTTHLLDYRTPSGIPPGSLPQSIDRLIAPDYGGRP